MRPCQSYPGYSATEDGVIVSHRLGGRNAGVFQHIKRPLCPRRDRYGYFCVTVSCGGRSVKKAVHTLVLDAFVGPKPEGFEARHLDGDRINNKSSNLRWGTHAENTADRLAHGRQYRGERHPQAKLNKATAAEVRRLASAGVRHRDIAKSCGISTGMVSYVARGLRWAL